MSSVLVLFSNVTYDTKERRWKDRSQDRNHSSFAQTNKLVDGYDV